MKIENGADKKIIKKSTTRTRNTRIATMRIGISTKGGKTGREANIKRIIKNKSKTSKKL